jgi:LysM repeat protein
VRLTRRAPGRLWIPLAVAAGVLLVAAVAGYGNSQVVAQMASAPGPRVTLPPSPSASASPTAVTTASPAPSPRGTPRPTPTPIIHIVQRGEFLIQIATRYGVDVQAIIDANQILDPDLVEPGQRLVIPAPGQSPAATATP